MNIVNQTISIFFPPAQQNSEVTFDSAVQDLTTQRVARIAKAIFFTISSVATTVFLVLNETEVTLTWPLTISFILTALVAGLIFYRLNSLDSTYVERLTDEIREACSKKELERIFLSQEPFTQEEIAKSLNGINRLLNLEIFDKKAISNILFIHSQKESKSIGETAVEQNKPIAIALGSEWAEQGRFGLPSYELNVSVNWTGIPTDSIIIKYQSKVKVEGQTPERPAHSVAETPTHSVAETPAHSAADPLAMP